MSHQPRKWFACWTTDIAMVDANDAGGHQLPSHRIVPRQWMTQSKTSPSRNRTSHEPGQNQGTIRACFSEKPSLIKWASSAFLRQPFIFSGYHRNICYHVSQIKRLRLNPSDRRQPHSTTAPLSSEAIYYLFFGPGFCLPCLKQHLSILSILATVSQEPRSLHLHSSIIRNVFRRKRRK